MTRPPRAVANYPGQPRRFNPQRRRGLVMLVVTGVATVLWSLLLRLLQDHHIVSDRRTLQVFACPFAFGIILGVVGLSKLVLGRTVDELGRDWDEMAGWQRFVTGAVIVAIAVTGMVLLGGLAIEIMM